MGGFFNILFALSVVIAVIFFSMDIFYKTNPKIINASLINKNPQKQTFKFTDFPVMVSLMDPITYVPYIDESVYRVEFENSRTFKGLNEGSKILKHEVCTIEHFKGFEDLVKNFDLANYYCLSREEPSFNILANFSFEEVYYFKVRIYSCQPTDPTPCKSEEEIEKLLAGTSIYIITLKNMVDQTNYDVPNITYMNNQFYSVGKDFFKGFSYSIKQLDIVDDIGVLYDVKETRTFWDCTLNTELIDFRQIPGGQFVELLFIWNEITDRTERIYKKFPEVLAEVGGILGGFRTVMALLMYLYGEFHFFNDFYQYCVNEKDDFSKFPKSLKTLKNDPKNRKSKKGRSRSKSRDKDKEKEKERDRERDRLSSFKRKDNFGYRDTEKDQELVEKDTYIRETKEAIPLNNLRPKPKVAPSLLDDITELNVKRDSNKSIVYTEFSDKGTVFSENTYKETRITWEGSSLKSKMRSMFNQLTKEQLVLYYKKMLDPRNLIEMRAQIMLLRKMLLNEFEDSLFDKTALTSRYLSELVSKSTGKYNYQTNANNENVGPDFSKPYVGKLIEIAKHYI